MLIDQCESRRSPLGRIVVAVSCLIPIGAPGQEAADTPARAAGGRTIAVMGFANTSDHKAAVGFNRALQEMLTTDLAVSRDVRVVERVRLEEVLKEQRLGKTEFLDQASAARVGKGLGAEAILTGSVWIEANDMRIDARLVHVETGEIILPASIRGKASAFLDLEKELATSIVEAMGARLSAFERASLSKRHTSDIEAATAFGEALEAEDAGNASLARERAAAALKLDPEFAMAKTIIRDIDSLLDAARAEDLRLLVDFLSGFELKLLSWPLSESPHILPRYREIVKDGDARRALVFWLENTEEIHVGSFLKQPLSMIFADPPMIDTDRGPGWGYLTAGAADIIKFWCDLAQDDPDLFPRRALTHEDLRPGASVWLLPDIYTKRFVAAVYCNGDMATAAQIAKDYADMCHAMGPDATLYPQLGDLRRQLPTMEGQRQLQQKRREYALRWSLVESGILDIHMYSQIVAFARPQRAKPPTLEEARTAFAAELLPRVRHLPEHQQRRFVENEIADAIKAVAPADFFTLPLNPVSNLRMAHVAGCPSVSDDHMLAHAEPLKSVDGCMAEGVVPCGTCRPLRWADPRAAGVQLATVGVELLDLAIKSHGHEWPAGLEDFLMQLIDAPTNGLRDRLVKLAKAMAIADGEYCCDRSRQKVVFQCLAAVVDENDVGWLEKLMVETPYFDVRASVGAVLGSIGSPKAAEALRRSVDEERLYFVRHALVAAMTRSLTTQYETQVNRAYSSCQNGQSDEAILAMQALLQDVEASPLPTMQKQRGLGVIHQALGDACISGNRPLPQATSHYRRAIQLFPEDHHGLPPALNALAYNLALQKDDLEGAEDAIRRALDLQQKMIEAGGSADDTAMLDTLAVVLLERGKLDEAKETIRRCVDRPAGQSLEIYDHWGDILWALEDHQAARNAWTRGLALATNTPDDGKRAGRVREKLAR